MGSKRSVFLSLLIGAFALFLAPCTLLSEPTSAESPSLLQAGALAETDIDIGVYLISIYDFEAGTGAYLADFYLWFSYSNQSIRNLSFELMNGLPAYPGAKWQIANNQNSTVQEIWYRVRANLYIVPELKDFPFERSLIQIVIEHPEFDSTRLRFHWNESSSGVNPEIFISGWTLDAPTYIEQDFNYSFNRTFSRVTFTVSLSRNDLSSGVQYLAPPLVFAVIGALGFLFPATKDSYVAARLGLTTSMLIAAVLFHNSVLSSLPPIGTLNVLDKIMLGVYVFLGSSSAVTLAGFVDVEYLKDPVKARFMQRYGFLLALAPTVIILIALLMVE